jgi:hypothetical protein
MNLRGLNSGISGRRFPYISNDLPPIAADKISIQLERIAKRTYHFVYGWYLNFWKQQQDLFLEDLCGPIP